MAPAPNLLAARQRRQFLSPSSRGQTDGDYLRILGALAPVRPPSFSFPGTPVCLAGRHEDPTPRPGESVRREGRVVKARFQHGLVAYVPREDLRLFAAAHARPLLPDRTTDTVLEALRAEGPLPKSLIAELTGAPSKALNAAMLALQRAFLIVEEQTETEWDSPWCAVESEHPGWLEDWPDRADARREVLRRFLEANAAATPREAADWSGFPQREAAGLLAELAARGEAEALDLDGQPAYAAPGLAGTPVEVEPVLVTLDPGDPLVTARASALKARFPDPVLRWVYQDGAIVGALEGRWGIQANRAAGLNLPDATGNPADLARAILADALPALGATALPDELRPFAPPEWRPPEVPARAG
ncbi:MAG TPA: crosslink repair DNA glycosylase YcaQ family protein [Deinococcales bacterium]|nr:crosslink repair DNA glycosylase YcaQ family protein [Deinococcales bacterium]